MCHISLVVVLSCAPRNRKILLHILPESCCNLLDRPTDDPDMKEITPRSLRTFPSTCWSSVREAGQPGQEAGEVALESLLRKYLEPLVCHLIAKFRLHRDQAEDLLQAFILDRVLASELIAHADCTRGRFRTFLLGSLDHFVCNEFRRQQTKRRSPKNGFVSLDELKEFEGSRAAGEFSDDFDTAWARTIMTEALKRMQAECLDKGRQDFWDLFDCRVLKPLLDNAQPLRYDELVRRFGFESPAQAYNALATSKRMFMRVLRSMIGEYARSEHEIDVEIEQWKAILCRTC